MSSQPDNFLSHPEVQALLKQGARDGFVSYSQINDLLVDLELDELDVEDLLTVLERRAIEVRDENPVSPAPKPQTPPQTPKSQKAAPAKPKKQASPNDDLDDILADLEKLEIEDDPESVAAFIAQAEAEADAADDLYAGEDLEDNQAPVADALKIYLNRMGQIERLEGDEERALAAVAHGDDPEAAREAKNKLVEANLRLVVHLATKAAPRTTLSITDLLQEGNLGLLDAVERYRAQSGKTFGAYATWWVRRALNRAINDHARTMKLSGELYGAIQKLQIAQRELSQKLGKAPTRAEIAEATGLSIAQIEEAQRAAERPLSLDQQIGGEDGSVEFGEQISDPEAEITGEIAERREAAQSLTSLLEDLSERERSVVQMRFGLGEYQEEGAKSADDIARILGISRERVVELETKAIRKLRKKAKGSGLDKLFGA